MSLEPTSGLSERSGETLSVPNLRHLRAIEAVARLASISKAAVEVSLSQPAVTQAVAKIEATVGRPLFERRQTGTFPTLAGEAYLARVRRFLSQCDAALGACLGPSGEVAARRLTSAHLRTLLALARSTSFTQAANATGTSSASLHRAMRELEALIPQKLYSASRYGLVLTDLGVELTRRLGLAVREIEAARDDLLSLEGETGGRIVIGALPMSGAYLIGATIAELTARHPGARVSVTTSPYGILFNSLRSGEIDMIFGVLRRPDWDQEIKEIPLFSDPYCIVGRAGHPLASRERVTTEDLLDYDWILPGEGTPRRRQYEALFEACSRRPSVSIETSSLSTIRSVLACSDRLTLVSRHEVETEERMNLLAVLPWTSSFPPVTKGISLRSNWLPTPIQQYFLDLLCSRASESTEP